MFPGLSAHLAGWRRLEDVEAEPNCSEIPNSSEVGA
jgi:hypothetical protein